MSRPIRVVFLVFYFEAWDALDAIYRGMLADPRFEPMVVSLPRKLTGYDKFRDENARCGVIVQNLWNMDEWVTALEISKRLLVLCFQCVIKFFAQAILDLRHHVFWIQTLEPECQQCAE